MNRSAPPLQPGQVYGANAVGRHRRVIAVVNGRVVYCVGSDHNRSCKVETFRRWLKKWEATRLDEQN